MWKVEREGDDFIVYKSEKQCPDAYPELPPGWEGTESGGQYPHYIAYNPEEVKVLHLSAKEREKWEEGILYLKPSDALLEEIPASAHGCWKAVRRQLLLVVRKDAQLREKVRSAYEIADECDEILPKEVVEKALEKAYPLPVGVSEEECEFCKRAKQRAKESSNPAWEYVVCKGHSTLDSLHSSTFNESKRYSYNYRIKSERPDVVKALYLPTTKIDFAFLTKDGEVYLVRGKTAFKTNSDEIKEILFGGE